MRCDRGQVLTLLFSDPGHLFDPVRPNGSVPSSELKKKKAVFDLYFFSFFFESMVA